MRASKVIVLCLGVLAFASTDARARSRALDTGKIEELTGSKGQLDKAARVFKVTAPRTDLRATVAGVKLTPPMGLSSWAAFQQAGAATMVMGDIVLLEDQVNPVMSVALENGLQVTALHNHFLWDSPRIMFMHIGGMGDAMQLARAVGKVFAKVRTTAASKITAPSLDMDAATSTLDGKKIDDIIGATGETAAGVHKIIIGRTTRMDGHEIGAAMGVSTWAAFAGSDERAVVDGDFVMPEGALQPVLKTLRGAGINIVAIHNHMTMESPRMVFLHYWGVGTTVDLARAIKRALAVSSTSP